MRGLELMALADNNTLKAWCYYTWCIYIL